MTTTSDSEERRRELRAQGAHLDATARAAPGERHLKAVRERTSATKPLGLVWVVTYYPLVAAGLEKTLEGKADVHIGGDSVAAGIPSCVVLYADGMQDGFVDGIGRVRELYPGVPLLVFGPRLDLALAWAALKNGADGFVHAAMERDQVIRAVEVVQKGKGELAAPRQLLRYLLSQEKNPNVENLSARQREILKMVDEGLSNAEIAGRLFLSESTIKQHLRAAYQLLGVRNRTEAAKTIRNHAQEL